MNMDRALTSAWTPEWEGADSPLSRRMEHSSMGWARKRDSVIGQPQDGAVTREALRLVPELGSRGALLPTEPDDAAVTGSTRSLMRRLMGLNISARPAQPTPIPVVRASTAAELRRTA